MERILEYEVWRVLNSSSQERRREVLTQFASLLVRLPSPAWQPFGSEHIRYRSGDAYALLDRWLETFRSFLVRFPIAGVEPVFEWLVSRREMAPCLRPSLLHRDFHPGNVLVRADGSAAVLDWTRVEVADARFDLGHTLVLLSCAGQPEWRDTVLKAYQESLEAPVEQLAYFEVAACFKWFFALTMSLRYGADKMGLGPEAVTRLKPAPSVLKRAHDVLEARTGLAVPRS